jgi:adenosylcobyric acid synthase
MAAQLLMVQGTASSVGKSLLVTALCRILRQDGLRVAPFKAQNMSNNSFVTAHGGEIGRAQVSQAEAAGIEPCTDMNPILLKPESDRRSQIVLNGSPFRTVGASEYFGLKQALWPEVAAALDRLREQFEAIVIEGAGSPAEINLKEGDIVNMRVARYAHAPVLLVGDIDRGGVFAHLVGTLELLEPEERALVRAFAINKVRGDPALLAPGLTMLEARTGVPVAGVVPYLHDHGVAEEDATSLESTEHRAGSAIDIAVIRLPHLSNFDDFDSLAAEPDVSLRYVSNVNEIGCPDLIILPGTKATIADLLWLRARGLSGAVTAATRRGTAVIGVCGGYQMLGSAILDPENVESSVGEIEGLNLLTVVTTFERRKSTYQAIAHVTCGEGLLAGISDDPLFGYEIHMGVTQSSERAPFRIDRRSQRSSSADDGAVSSNGWILGTYLHGLFANDGVRSAMLTNLLARRGLTRQSTQRRPLDEVYDALAAEVRPALDMQLIHELMQSSRPGVRAGRQAASWES